MLYKLGIERIRQWCSLQAQSRAECSVKARGSAQLIAEVLCHSTATESVVNRQRRQLDEIFVIGLTLNQFPQAVLSRNRVDNLASPDLLN